MGNFKEYLPSGQFTKIALSLFVLASLVGVALIYPEERTVKYSSQGAELGAGTLGNIVSIAGSIDKDEDGLKDWEEALFKSDPNNKDTDGDGTPDGEEVKLGRNPIIPGPKDALLAFNTSGMVSSESSFENLTATDKVSRQLFAEYIQAKQSGGTIDSATEARIITSAISKSGPTEKARFYTEGELNVISESGESSLRKYGNAVGAILKKYPGSKENELVILGRAIEKDDEDENELSQLDVAALAYQNTIKDMLILSVPKKAIQIHLSVINEISAVEKINRDMRNVYKDPITAISSTQEYIKTVTNLVESLKNAGLFFEKESVIFKENEDGYYYANIVK